MKNAVRRQQVVASTRFLISSLRARLGNLRLSFKRFKTKSKGKKQTLLHEKGKSNQVEILFGLIFVKCLDEQGPLVMDDSSSEDDVEVRAQIEREEIVERYDKVSQIKA